jgi:phenol hydroxylase P0 protein
MVFPWIIEIHPVDALRWHASCEALPMPTHPRTTLAEHGEPEPLICDPARKYVCVTEVRADGLVAFDFSIGWPELSVELMLPRAAFDEFCATNRVILLEARAQSPTPVDNPEETDE